MRYNQVVTHREYHGSVIHQNSKVCLLRTVPCIPMGDLERIFSNLGAFIPKMFGSNPPPQDASSNKNMNSQQCNKWKQKPKHWILTPVCVQTLGSWKLNCDLEFGGTEGRSFCDKKVVTNWNPTAKNVTFVHLCVDTVGLQQCPRTRDTRPIYKFISQL